MTCLLSAIAFLLLFVAALCTASGQADRQSEEYARRREHRDPFDVRDA